MIRLLPNRVRRPITCTACGRRFQGGPLEEVAICSPQCFEADQAIRFQRPRPDGEPDDNDPAWRDFLEERRQVARERRLVEALVQRFDRGGDPDNLEDCHWLELAQADLGASPNEVPRRIDELVRMYLERRRRHPELATLDAEGIRRRLWAMVPARVAQRLTS